MTTCGPGTQAGTAPGPKKGTWTLLLHRPPCLGPRDSRDGTACPPCATVCGGDGQPCLPSAPRWLHPPARASWTLLFPVTRELCEHGAAGLCAGPAPAPPFSVASVCPMHTFFYQSCCFFGQNPPISNDTRLLPVPRLPTNLLLPSAPTRRPFPHWLLRAALTPPSLSAPGAEAAQRVPPGMVGHWPREQGRHSLPSSRVGMVLSGCSPTLCTSDKRRYKKNNEAIFLELVSCGLETGTHVWES